MSGVAPRTAQKPQGVTKPASPKKKNPIFSFSGPLSKQIQIQFQQISEILV